MNIKKLIKTDRCLFLNSVTKTEAFHEIIELVEKENLIKDIENVKKEIFYREQIMSTGIGQGIGIPHIRFGDVTEPQVFIGISKSGIEDYESLDSIPVQIIIMIIVGADKHKEYLRTLSLIVGCLKDERNIKKLISAESVNEIEAVFNGDES